MSGSDSISRVRGSVLCLLVFAERGDDRLKFVALTQLSRPVRMRRINPARKAVFPGSSSRAAKIFSFSNILYLQIV